MRFGSFESINKNNLEGNYPIDMGKRKNKDMKIEYPDGKVHNVECYKFCKAVLENGEVVFFIEYYDHDNKINGEPVDSYGIVENINGIWYKSSRDIPYNKLSSKVVKELNVNDLGDKLKFIDVKKDLMPQTQTKTQRQETSPIDEQKVSYYREYDGFIPQTQTKAQKQKNPPKNREEISFINGYDNSMPQTQTKAQRQETPPKNYKEKSIIYVPISINENNKIDWVLLESAAMTDSLYGFVYDKINYDVLVDGNVSLGKQFNFISFKVMTMPSDIYYKIKNIANGDNYDKLMHSEIETDSSIIKFLPASRMLHYQSFKSLEIEMKGMRPLPKKALEDFFGNKDIIGKAKYEENGYLGEEWFNGFNNVNKSNNNFESQRQAFQNSNLDTLIYAARKTEEVFKKRNLVSNCDLSYYFNTGDISSFTREGNARKMMESLNYIVLRKEFFKHLIYNALNCIQNNIISTTNPIINKLITTLKTDPSKVNGIESILSTDDFYDNNMLYHTNDFLLDALEGKYNITFQNVSNVGKGR